MPRRRLTLALAVTAVLVFWVTFHDSPTASAAPPGDTSGALTIVGKDGKVTGACPLQHTEVRGAISGFLSRVTVTQIFGNPATRPIEAVYTFPLPESAAVDDMTIQIGSRTVRGVIKRREEAQKIYEKAIREGHTAALLDQERPNIFTQSVGNIPAGEEVRVTISYVETLRYEDGAYEFVFPIVVGPRYIPGNATGQQGTGWAPDTDKVPDASRITPHVAPKGTRAGHDISLELAIDAGVPILGLDSKSHEIDIDRSSASTATVRLRNENEIPNKDFILEYDVAGGQIEDAVLVQPAALGSKGNPGGFFTLILQPPARFPESDVTPKELVFVLDTSGSMSGFPIEKAKEVIDRALNDLYPGDTFNLITFAGDTRILFPEPVYPTAENISRARKFLNSREGGGGTEMMKAIRAALDPSDSQEHVRIVCFLTDGYVGNDMEIIGEIQKHPNTRVFSFGIGTSVNRFLLENMAKAGRGAAEFVTLADKAEPAAKRFYQRVRSPLLTDVSLDWGSLPVTDVYPARLPDLFSGQPLVISGRYSGPAEGTVRLRGHRAGADFAREIPVHFTAASDKSDAQPVLATFWARQKIDDLMSQEWNGLQNGNTKPEIQKEITQLGLDYRLMTQFTSFVAVEDRIVTKDGRPERVAVPVDMPEGVSHEGVFGEADKKTGLYAFSTNQQVAGFIAGGAGGGIAAGRAMKAMPLAAPPSPSLIPQAETVEVQSATADVLPVTSARTRLASKLAPRILAAYDCWQKPDHSACNLPASGRIEVQVILADDSATSLNALKALGFEVARTSSKTIIGSLPVENLPKLAALDAVRFVSPPVKTAKKEKKVEKADLPGVLG